MKNQIRQAMKHIEENPDTSYIGTLEFQDNMDEWHEFEVYDVGASIVFGGNCNSGFLISGFLTKEEDETLDEALAELLEDLKVYYNDGEEYCSRIECNDRM